MPDSFGKRNREKAKAKKAEARDDRRIARNQRRKGIVPFSMSDPVDNPDGVTGEAEAQPPGGAETQLPADA